jgi:guanosine-3',5'-bis(diphosphate) 3'-pyrophosphohydrolase
MNETDLSTLFRALRFAADHHRDDRRKGAGASPYINHPIEVASVLVEAGVDDPEVLAAALLHDTVEDTWATPEEIEAEFGPRVRALVEAVTDDKSLRSGERKRLQVVHAADLEPDAKLIKIADKTANVHDVGHDPPARWTLERRRDYLEWTERVVEGCRGVNETLERRYDVELASARQKVRQAFEAEGTPPAGEGR